MDHNSEEKVPKKQEEGPILRSCEKCTKFFTTQSAYDTHVNLKHGQREQAESEQQEEEEGSEEEEQERSRPNNAASRNGGRNLPVKGRMLEIHRNQLEDNIYTFLGQLGEKNVEPAATRAEITSFSTDQKLTGQTNYSVNKVIRTPYEEPIKCSSQITERDIEQSPHQQFLAKLKRELIILEAKIEEQRDQWQLRDPMAPEEEVADEFSLMDIRKLILNYPSRNLNLDHPHFSIFLLWIGRICKSPAFREFYLILGSYLADYYSKQSNRQKSEGAYDLWKVWHRQYEKKPVDERLLGQLQIFDDRSCQKLVEFYVKWGDLFHALTI